MKISRDPPTRVVHAHAHLLHKMDSGSLRSGHGYVADSFNGSGVQSTISIFGFYDLTPETKLFSRES